MKIAMIGQKGIPVQYGGVEKHVQDLSVRLVERGHQVSVYSRTWYTGNSGTDRYQGITRIHTPTIKTKHFDAIVHVFTSTVHALCGSYDVFHYHGVGPALLAWIPRVFRPSARVIITLHSLDRFHQKWNRCARFFLKLGERAACVFAHETITVSRSLERYAKHTLHRDTRYIPNGVTIPTHKEDQKLITPFGLSKGEYIVMISRLVPHKGAHILVEAFKKLKERNPGNREIQKLKLAIVGGAAYTDAYIRELHLSASAMNDVVFTDFQKGDTLGALYRYARVMVHPSLNEGLPITVLQAMSYGLPVLLSSISEHREIIDDREVLFGENDVQSLVHALEHFMKLHSEERVQLGKRNKAIVQEKYDWENIVEKTEAIYRTTVAEKHSIASVGHVS